MTVDYAFQDINDIPGSVPEGQNKALGNWSGGSCSKELHYIRHLLYINADDYYGKEGISSCFITGLVVERAESAIAMAGFVLKNTLSDNGGVTRGVCRIEYGQSHLTDCSG